MSNKDEKEKKLQEISRIKKESFSEKDLKSLEDKSLIVNNNQHINLQSIIGRFAHFKFDSQSEDKKIEFYKKGYGYNAFLLRLLHDKNISYSVRVNLFENNKNNFLKCLEYIKYLELDFDKFNFIDDLCGKFTESSPNKKIFDKLRVLKSKVSEDITKINFLEINILNLEYFYYDFDYVYKEILKKYPFISIIDSSKKEKDIESLYINTLLNIYAMEGYQFELFKLERYRTNFNFYLTDIGEYSICHRFLEKDLVPDTFTKFELKLNTSLVKDTNELKRYIPSINKTQIIEKVQSTYTLLKADSSEVNLRTIKKLIVSNPFTDGLKTLMIAIKDDKNCSKIMYEEAIEKLYHIKYFHVEAILLYCEYLKGKENSIYSIWFSKGRELAKKHYYRYLLHQFNCLDSGVYLDYDENDYPLPEKLDYSEIIKKYNL